MKLKRTYSVYTMYISITIPVKCVGAWEMVMGVCIKVKHGVLKLFKFKTQTYYKTNPPLQFFDI
jgi:hypothetical protein